MRLRNDIRCRPDCFADERQLQLGDDWLAGHAERHPDVYRHHLRDGKFGDYLGNWLLRLRQQLPGDLEPEADADAASEVQSNCSRDGNGSVDDQEQLEQQSNCVHPYNWDCGVGHPVAS